MLSSSGSLFFLSILTADGEFFVAERIPPQRWSGMHGPVPEQKASWRVEVNVEALKRRKGEEEVYFNLELAPQFDAGARTLFRHFL